MKIYSRLVHLLILCTLLLFPAHSVSAAFVSGLVVEVLDGATIIVNVDNRLVKVRLCALTPPTNDHALSGFARSHLDFLVKGKQVAVDYKGLDRDGALIGIVTFNETDIGMQMIRDGAASYSRDGDRFLASDFRRLYEEM